MIYISIEEGTALYQVYLLKEMKSKNNYKTLNKLKKHILKGIGVDDEELDFKYSNKKRKDILEGSLDEVLFPTEIEFPKILAPRIPQNSSNVNNECAGKSK